MLRLDVELRTAKGKRLGLLARLRDLLPGRYAFGLTGPRPGGSVLAPGRYRLRVFAWPTGGGAPTSARSTSRFVNEGGLRLAAVVDQGA